MRNFENVKIMRDGKFNITEETTCLWYLYLAVNNNLFSCETRNKKIDLRCTSSLADVLCFILTIGEFYQEKKCILNYPINSSDK